LKDCDCDFFDLARGSGR